MAPPCSNLRSFGSKCVVQKSTCDIVGTFRRPPQPFDAPKIIRCPGNFAPLVTPLAAADHDVAQTAKILVETAAVSKEIEFDQAFGYKTAFQCNVASLCVVHHPAGLWNRNTNFGIWLQLQAFTVFGSSSKIIWFIKN